MMPTRRKRSSETGAPRRSQNVRRFQARLLGLVILLCASSAVTAVSAAAASPPSHIRATQQLAQVLFGHQAYRYPRSTAPRVMYVPARTPITGDQTTLPVIGQAHGHGDTRWLKVTLPGRPNGLTGWIARGGTNKLITPWHITVSLAARRVSIYLHGHRWRTFSAVVGKPSSPTPTGNFFVQETVILPATAAGGPFALALSARSNVYTEFDGGPGQIAIHGRDLLGGTLGQAQSHGCVRLDTSAISWLAARIGPGVPVTIYR